MKITILSQRNIYLVTRFITIIFSILNDCLRNRIKFFLDDISIKKLTTKYNNQKLALKICCFVIGHI